MGRSLRYLGMALLAATAWLLIADAAEWVPDRLATEWVHIGIKAGLACLAGGILLGIFNPVRREWSRGRCARCGRSIARGQTYCLDHLQATINEYRDQMHARSTPKRRA